MQNGVIANKLQTLDEVLNEVRSLGKVRGQQLRDEVLAYVQKIDWRDTAALWETWSAVIAVWVFGSAQGGEVRVGSDVDVAVLGERPFTLNERLQIVDQLQAQLQFDDIDLIILNEANVILRFEAVSGRLLFCRDKQRMAAFVSLTAREYEDEMAQWRLALQFRNHYLVNRER